MKENLNKYYNCIFKDYPDVVNVKTMCHMLGDISLKTGYQLLKENKIEHFQIGRSFYISKYHILCYMKIFEK